MPSERKVQIPSEAYTTFAGIRHVRFECQPASCLSVLDFYGIGPNVVSFQSEDIQMGDVMSKLSTKMPNLKTLLLPFCDLDTDELTIVKRSCPDLDEVHFDSFSREVISELATIGIKTMHGPFKCLDEEFTSSMKGVTFVSPYSHSVLTNMARCQTCGEDRETSTGIEDMLEGLRIGERTATHR